MKITKEMEEMIVNCGTFGYDIGKMANVLGLNKDDVEIEMSDTDSEFYMLYNLGTDKADYLIDLKLFELAKTGDLKALQKYETRKNQRSNDL